MIRRAVLFVIGLVVLLTAGSATLTWAQIDSNTGLPASHRVVLESWLRNKPLLRLATEADCQNKVGLEATRQEQGREYQPYYAVGDFNRDGEQDFAVALIESQKRSRRFAIAIFNGPFNQKRPILPAFFVERIDLSEGGLVVLSGNRLVAGVFQSDNCVVLRPRGRSYVMKTCL